MQIHFINCKYLHNLLITVLFVISVSCHKNRKEKTVKEGFWRGEIAMQDQTLPFLFKISKENETYLGALINGEERIALDEVTIANDSLFITLHIFDIELRAKIEGDKLTGHYIKNYKEHYKLPFRAIYGQKERFDNPASSTAFDGKWQTQFTEEDGTTYPAVGIFKQQGDLVKGTFLTETGDYRYLEGTATNDAMTLYTFDGNHAFVFDTKLEKDTLKGTFFSGKDYKATFQAYQDEKAALKNAYELTYLKEGYDKIAFSFPNLKGESITLEDKKYQEKVVLLQIFGTWCPNCMDETKFYAEWYRKNKQRPVEILGLAYEAKDDFNYAKSRVEKMKEKLQVDYDFVIAGVYDKKAAAESLPMLNHVLSFPTTIFIDKKGKIRRIHTGFSGPATGTYYQEFKEEFNRFMDELISE